MAEHLPEGDALRERLTALEGEVTGLRPDMACLQSENTRLPGENPRLQAENAGLRRRLELNSENSHQSPSCDGYRTMERGTLCAQINGICMPFIRFILP